MIKEITEWRCDACCDIEMSSGRFYPPKDWVGVDISANNHTDKFHFCNKCWAEGKKPTKVELPAFLRRFFFGAAT